MTNKKDIQESEYSFPYHYIPSLNNGTPSVTRFLNWGWDYLTYIDFVTKKIKELEPSTVLDIGCGDGYMINTLFNDNVAFDLKGVDFSERAIAFANAFCRSENKLFHVEDIFNLDEKYDIVTLIEVIEHIPDELLEKFIQKSFELSNKYVIISVPTTVLPLSSKHYRHYDEELLLEQTQHCTKDFELAEQQRIYKKSQLLKLLNRLFNNKVFHINSKLLNKMLWKFHCKYSYFANKENGYHLVSIYKRKQ